MFIANAPAQPFHPGRIVSLVPSQTELLYYLGLEAETVGITKFCVHPAAWFRSKTRVGGTKDVNINTVLSLCTDLVIANKEENVKEQVEKLARDTAVWVTDVNDLAGAWQMIRDIGALCNREKQASQLLSRLHLEFDNLFQLIPVSLRIPVVYLIWKNPYMTVGGDNFIQHMLEAAGYKNVFSGMSRYPEISVEEINNSDARLVFLSSEPYPFRQKHVHELRKMLPGKTILLVDGEMFSWYGSRMLLAPAYFKKLSALHGLHA